MFRNPPPRWNNRAHRIVPEETRRNEHQPNRSVGESHVEAVLSLENATSVPRLYIDPPLPIVSGQDVESRAGDIVH